MNKVSGIYKITNIQNGKVYVGQSVNIIDRWSHHRSELSRNIHSNDHLQNAYNQYGLEYFAFEILEECCQEHTNAREEFWISHYKSDDRKFGYNVLGWINAKRSVPKETRIKIGESQPKPVIPRIHSEATKKKMSESHKGKISIKGRIPWNKGMSHSIETREKMKKSSHDKNGEKSRFAKLTNEKVLEIVRLRSAGISAKQLGIDFNVAKSTIFSVCNGRSWSHITGIPKKRTERKFKYRKKQ